MPTPPPIEPGVPHGAPRLPRRRILLAGGLSPLVGLAPAGCAEDGSAPAVAFGPPPGYAHLTPLRLNVADIEIGPPPSGPAGAVMGPAPIIPAEAMATMARDRLVPAGSSGVARFTIQEASLVRNDLPGGMFARGGERLVCALRCRLDLFAGEGGGTGFVEAQARRVLTAPGPTSPERRSAAADRVVRAAMDAMNVELEYQIRRNLRGWLLASPPPGVAPPPGAGGLGGPEEVLREDLPRQMGGR
ncbi:hypothetical protein GCM10010964_37460 [Caldovatus sediminis]|uniref:Lipoprotein n=1 Tax=Caldovatus sediminis TaxID=2041189 RepID=A0A8J2ZE01_9PROT|nr:hypothetical protein [Caldovatus sediminis]GGG46602.1 hypothetical protein GCM10010964_37460 [Caldovatus sediminis]